MSDATLSDADRALTSGWQLIETARKDGTQVMIYAPDEQVLKRVQVVAWQDLDFECDGWYPVNGPRVERPTHWMPLPAPPDPRD